MKYILIAFLFQILPLKYLLGQQNSLIKENFQIDGYYRFLGFHRNINNIYGNSEIPSVFQANDDFNSPSVSPSIFPVSMIVSTVLDLLDDKNSINSFS